MAKAKLDEELADLPEVLYAVTATRGCTPEQLKLIRAEKAAKRGGFAAKILLKKVADWLRQQSVLPYAVRPMA